MSKQEESGEAQTRLSTLQRQCFYQYLKDPMVGPRITNSIQSTLHIPDVREVLKFQLPRSCPPVITVSQEDPVEVARECLFERKERTAIHCPSHLDHPGGQWWKERADVETDFCLRSTLVLSLEDKWGYDVDRKWRYPISPYSIIHSPDVVFLRDPQGQVYNRDKTLWMPILSSGIRAVPNVKKDGTLRPADGKMIQTFYEGLFMVTEQLRYDSVVLYGIAGLDDLFHYPHKDVLSAVCEALRTCPLRHVAFSLPWWDAGLVDKFRVQVKSI